MKNKKSYLIAFLLVGFFATLFVVSESNKQQELRSQAASITVSPGGSIQAALDSANAGDTVVVKAGTYTGAITFKKNDVTLQGEAGATIDGAGSTARGLVTFDGRSNIKIIGMTVTNAGGHGMYGGGGVSNITIQNNTVSNSKDGGIFVGDGSNVIIDGNTVTNNNGGASGGDIGQAANEGVTLFNIKTFEIMNNKVFGNHEEGIDVKNGTTDGSIHNNMVYENNGPNIYIDGASNTKVFSNMAYNAKGSSKAGIGLAVESGGAASNLEIYNNILYGNPGGGIDMWTGSYSNIKAINNTIANNGKGAITGSGITNSIARNNIIFNNAISASGYTADHNLTTDPGFVSATDFHLKAGSPAIDAGVSDGAPTTDFAGATRPVGSAIDIGAYEFGGIATNPGGATAAPTVPPTTPTLFCIGNTSCGENPSPSTDVSISSQPTESIAPVSEVPTDEVSVDPSQTEPTDSVPGGGNGNGGDGGNGHGDHKGLFSLLMQLIALLFALLLKLFGH